MKISSLATLTLAALATASNILRRDVPTVLAAIDKLKTDITDLTNSIATYDGNGPRALEIQAQVTDLEDVVQAVTDSITASDKFDTADSTKVATAILSLQPLITASLTNITSSKGKFEAALPGIAASLIAQDLVALQQHTDALGKAVTEKLTGAFATAAPQIIAMIDKQFQTAIDSYGGPNPPVTYAAGVVLRPLSFVSSIIALGAVGLVLW